MKPTGLPVLHRVAPDDQGGVMTEELPTGRFMARGDAAHGLGGWNGQQPRPEDECPYCHQKMPTPGDAQGPSLVLAWLRDTGTSQRDFAAELGITESGLCKILKSVNAPGATVALAIECLTKGRVGRDTWPKITGRSRKGPE